ncbi:MAG: (2Fe-2S) ferredoxin domain-containing protein [Candidatus Wallbacteria bacterium]
MIENKSVNFLRHIFICTNFREGEGAVCCKNGGSEEIYRKLKEYVKANDFGGKVKITQSRCFSMCPDGPNMVIYPEQIWFNKVTAGDIEEIIKKYIDPFKK